MIAEHPALRVDKPSARALCAGVYGLKVVGIEAASLMASVDSDAPALSVTAQRGTTAERNKVFYDDHAEIALVGGGSVSLHRDGRAHFTLPHELSAAELLHPWLAPVAATFNGWNGRQVLHGGVLALRGRALAVVGNKEDGKSSLLAWTSQVGDVEILADDLAVIDGNTVFAGPRCIDLRPGVVQAFEEQARISLVRDGTRLRRELKPCSPTAALAGVIVLAWGEDPVPRIHQLGPAPALAALLPHAVNARVHDGLLGLLSVPVFKLVRPRTWESMPGVVEQLLGLLR